MSAGNPWVWRTCGAPRRSHSNAPSTSAGIGVSSRSTTVTSHPARDSAIAAASPPMPAPTTTALVRSPTAAILRGQPMR